MLLFDLRKKDLRWRRVAVYWPVRIDANDPTTDVSHPRFDSWSACHPGMRVLLRRDPSRDRDSVALVVNGGHRIGRLPAEVAAWVAPLLDSGTAVFDAEIWPLKNDGRDPHAPAFQLMLTHHELAPKPRRSLAAWLSGAGRLFPKHASPRSVEA